MLLLALAALAMMQTSVPLLAPCPPPSPFAGRPYFDFQVSQPAVYLAEDSTRIRPDASQNGMPPHPPDFVLAQFVVDSLGVPIPGTLKLLVKPTGLSIDAVGLAIIDWRYQPARVDACRVAQLVQTPLTWR